MTFDQGTRTQQSALTFLSLVVARDLTRHDSSCSSVLREQNRCAEGDGFVSCWELGDTYHLHNFPLGNFVRKHFMTELGFREEGTGSKRLKHLRLFSLIGGHEMSNITSRLFNFILLSHRMVWHFQYTGPVITHI